MGCCSQKAHHPLIDWSNTWHQIFCLVLQFPSSQSIHPIFIITPFSCCCFFLFLGAIIAKNHIKEKTMRRMYEGSLPPLALSFCLAGPFFFHHSLPHPFSTSSLTFILICYNHLSRHTLFLLKDHPHYWWAKATIPHSLSLFARTHLLLTLVLDCWKYTSAKDQGTEDKVKKED